MNIYLILFFSILLYGASVDEIPFDKSKVDGYDTTVDINHIVTPIKNQVWIASKKLSQNELETLVLNKYKFKIIAYKKVYGLLVEIDEEDKEQLSILEEIRLLDTIDNVYNRVYEGNSAFKTYPSLSE